MKLTKKQKINFWKYKGGELKGNTTAQFIIKKTTSYIGERVLDVGAGDGALIKLISKKFKVRFIRGIDIAPKDKIVMRGDCTNLNYPANYFDTYYNTDLLEHLTNKELYLTLNEAYRVLKKGGYAVFSTVTHPSLKDHFIMCPYCEKEFNRMLNEQTFNRTSLVDLLTDNKFKIVKIIQFNYFMVTRFGLLGSLYCSLNLDKFFKIAKNKDILIVAKVEG